MHFKKQSFTLLNKTLQTNAKNKLGIEKILKRKMHKIYLAGFTLIELLIVIAIIGILASAVIFGVKTAVDKSRDARRLEDIKNIQTAIEVYYADNGIYPLCDGNTVCSTTGYQGNLANLQISPTYLNPVPTDPTNINGQYGYYYARRYKKTSSNTFIFTGSSTDYIMATRFQDNSNPLAVPNFSAWNNGNLNYLAGN